MLLIAILQQNLSADFEVHAEQLSQTKEMIQRLSSSHLMAPFHNNWIDESIELDRRFNKLHKVLSKRSEHVAEYKKALQRYRDDSKELSIWLQKKEEELASLKQQYQQHLNLETLHFVDKCQV